MNFDESLSNYPFSNRSSKVIVRNLPYRAPDSEIKNALREIIPSTLRVHSIDIRTTCSSKTTMAFIHLIDHDQNDVSEVVKRLNGASILGQNVYAKEDSSFNNSVKKQNANDYGLTPDIRSHSRSKDYSRSLSPVRKFRSPSYHSPPPAPPVISYQEPELLQLHLAPIPLSFSEELSRTLLTTILNVHFKNPGTIRLMRNPRHGTAFINVYNFSNEPTLILMERISKISLGGHRIDISFQKNPRNLSYQEQQELDAQIEYRKYLSTSGNLATTSFKTKSPEMIKLFISRFPISMSEAIIRSHLDSILQKAFQSQPFSVLIRSTSAYQMAFVDIINRSGDASLNILVNIPQLTLNTPEGVFAVKVSVQKAVVGDTYVPNVVKNEAYGIGQFDGQRVEVADRFEDIDRRKGIVRTGFSPSTLPNQFHPRSPRRSRSRSPRRKSSIRNLSPLPFKNRDEDSKPDVLDPFELVEKDTRSTGRESSPDPFDITSKSSSHPHTSLIVSTLDTGSIETLIQPLSKPLDSNNFSRIASTRIQFGYLSSLDAEKVFSNSAPYSNDEDSQIRYEKFLGGQRGDKEYYYNILEKVKDFSGRNKRFSDIAKALVSSDRK